MTPRLTRLTDDAAERAIRSGMNQAPEEERQAAATAAAAASRSNHQGDTPAEQHRAPQSGVAGVLLSATEFAQEDEEQARPLLGTEDDMLLSAGGTLFMYGKGGAGKTTLTLDAIAHLAAGTEWLGQPVATPLTILLIENEGPRALLRRRIRDKLDTWDAEPWGERVLVWTEPWMGFTFKAELYRMQVAAWVDEHHLDLVVVGPLAAIGAIGGGTPDEVTEFGGMLEDVRRRTDLPVAFWIIHHENKSGDVSGAWDRLPDTLCHVTGQGNGHTRLHFAKARWSALHDTALHLTWDESRSFTVDDPKPSPEDMVTRVRELYEEEDRWRSTQEVWEAVQGSKRAVTDALKSLRDTGWITEQTGVDGYQHNAHCWRHEPDPQSDEQQSMDGEPLNPDGEPVAEPVENKPGSAGSASSSAGPEGEFAEPGTHHPEGVGPGGSATNPADDEYLRDPEEDEDIPW